MAHVLAPVGRRNLVLDQGVDGFGVGHAQQCLGQAHEGDAFVRGKAVFREEHFHQAGAGFSADFAHEIGGTRDDAGAVGFGQRRQLCQPVYGRGFIGIGGKVDGAADIAVIWHGIPSRWIDPSYHRAVSHFS